MSSKYSRPAAPWRETLAKLLPDLDGDYPCVVDDGETKALYFDSRNVQSRMRKDAPHELQLGYTRTMMGFLLLQPEPRDILLVGLGGGSLSKFCHYHLQHCTVTTVEIDPQVVALRDEFAIPPDNEHFRIVCADAVDYLAGNHAIADVILLDGFADYGLPHSLSNPLFYDKCYKALRDGGVLVANLWDKDATLQRCRDYLGARFQKNIATAGAAPSRNIIAFAAKNPDLPPWPRLQQRAYRLREEMGLDFPQLLDDMRCSSHLRATAAWLTRTQVED
jgi:spermidine synthase